MDNALLGIHHVTAIAGDVQHNVDFYAGVLGLRLVKRTVNFDDPGTYHLYYGDEAGRPGTILTFFPWPHAPHGRSGTGQVTVTALSVPPGSLPYWTERLRKNGIAIRGTGTRFGEPLLAFADLDGMQVELVEGGAGEGHAVQGIHSVTLSEEGYERTAALLTGALGFTFVGEEGNRFRYQLADGGPGALVDVLCRPEAPHGQIAVGSVHHVAWRVAGDEEQKSWRREIADIGLNVSPVMDRQYFRSIYFREPGGVLFEIATDPPGFAADEAPEALGARLMLPPWLEPQRQLLEHILPPLRLPGEGD
jgi:glyoxalase family protein